jgi:PKD repeat protein
VAAGTPASAGARPYALDSGASAPGPAGGLTPAQLASAYEFKPGAGGAGQTVAIVDAFDDPNIEADLATFDTHYGLPACTTANFCLEKVGQTGSPSSLPAADTQGWSVEITLDVETVHSVCPNCRILLVEANTPTLANLAIAVNEAVALGATEVSNSYGGPEIGPQLNERKAYDHPGVAIVASTGDDGYYGWDFINEGFFGEEMPSTPASLPTVVAVGGTSLELDPTGNTRASETVWNENGPADGFGSFFERREGATGGGCSKLFTAQPWQQAVPEFAASKCNGMRLGADVSAVADPLTGFDIYDSYKCGPECEFARVEGGWATFGGTSLSAPLITALYGLAGGGRVPYPSLTLYGHLSAASTHFDVTEGGSGYCGGEATPPCEPAAALGQVDCHATTACNAASGFDGPSGVGTPDGLGLFEPLLPTATFTSPAPLKSGVAATFSGGSSSDPYPGGSVAGYSWRWGDGTANSSGISPTHAYAAPGSYTVTLTVTDRYGVSSAPSTQSVEVTKSTPAEEEAAGKRKQQEEEAAAKQKQQEEAAAAKRHEEEATAAGHEAPKLTIAPTSSQQVAAFQVHSPPAVPDAELASTALTASASGAVSIRVSCPADEVSCKGTVTLRTLTAVSSAVAGGAKRKAILTLANGSFAVAGGKVATVTLHLSARARALLARSHSMRVAATIVARDPAGAGHTTKRVVTLRAAKPKPGHH